MNRVKKKQSQNDLSLQIILYIVKCNLEATTIIFSSIQHHIGIQFYQQNNRDVGPSARSLMMPLPHRQREWKILYPVQSSCNDEPSCQLRIRMSRPINSSCDARGIATQKTSVSIEREELQEEFSKTRDQDMRGVMLPRHSWYLERLIWRNFRGDYTHTTERETPLSLSNYKVIDTARGSLFLIIINSNC